MFLLIVYASAGNKPAPSLSSRRVQIACYCLGKVLSPKNSTTESV